MRKRTKVLVGGLTVALALAAAVGTAGARRFEVSEQRFLMLFREATYQGSGGEGGAQVICDINLEGSFHSRTISKVSGQLIGYITEAVAHHPCQRGEWFMLNGIEVIEGRTVPNALPWHITYLTFIGALPNITGIEVGIRNYGFLVTVLGVACLFQSTERQPTRGILNLTTRGSITSFRFNESASIPKHEGGILCPSTIGFLGTAPVGTQTEWRLIFVRLVA